MIHLKHHHFNQLILNLKPSPEFNMYTLIHKPTRVKSPSASLLDNIYTNTQITIDNCQSGILTSIIIDHFFI